MSDLTLSLVLIYSKKGTSKKGTDLFSLEKINLSPFSYFSFRKINLSPFSTWKKDRSSALVKHPTRVATPSIKNDKTCTRNTSTTNVPH